MDLGLVQASGSDTLPASFPVQFLRFLWYCPPAQVPEAPSRHILKYAIVALNKLSWTPTIGVWSIPIPIAAHREIPVIPHFIPISISILSFWTHPIHVGRIQERCWKVFMFFRFEPRNTCQHSREHVVYQHSEFVFPRVPRIILYIQPLNVLFCSTLSSACVVSTTANWVRHMNAKWATKNFNRISA